MAQIIQNIENTNTAQQKRLRQFFGYRTNNSVLDDFVLRDLRVTDKSTKLKRAYEHLARLYNRELLENRRIKKIEIEKKIRIKRKSRIIDKKIIIKKSTYILQSDNLETILERFYDILKDVYKKGLTINVVKEGGVDKNKFKIGFSYTFTNKTFTKDYQEIFDKFIKIDSDDNRLQHDPQPYTLYVNVGDEIDGKKIIQAFKDGVTNCFFKPIIEWCELKVNESKTKSTMEKYRARANSLKKLELQYRDTGVNENDMSFLANKYQINIEINTPFQKGFIKIKCNKKALTTFRFINTRINHLEHNEVVNLAPTLIKQDEMNEIKINLKDNFHTYTRNMNGFSSISTLDTTYKLDNEYNNIINEFEKNTGLNECYLDDFQDVDISLFIRQGVHFNECIDINYDESSDYHTDKKNIYLNHIDMVKAYTGFKECKYYDGFVGKLFDFRPTNKIVEIGYYRIQKLNFDNAYPPLKEYNDVMKIYNDNVYPSPEIKFLQDNGVEFEIISGCWGSHLDFEFTEQMKNEKCNGVPFYSRWTGNTYHYSEYRDFYMNCNKELADNIVAVSDYDIVSYNNYSDEIKVSYRKQHNNHLSHVCGFITSYMRMNVLEQLFKININNVVRVCVDGIYYDGDKVECVNIFRDKPEPIKLNSSSDSYVSNYDCDLPFCENNEREHYLKELHAGVGGSGKTHLNINDKGLVRKLFVAPSWKLSKAKNIECGIANQVWANISCQDPEKIMFIRENYNVLIIDEISMMSDEMKNYIFELYPDMKIIMCGDIGYQAKPFNDDGSEVVVCTETGFDKVIRYNINRRCKCSKLQAILDLCREQIDDKFLYTTVKKAVKQRITIEQLKKKYCKKDMILCRTNTKKDVYTDMFKDIEKFYILKTDRNYCKGDIVYERPNSEYYKQKNHNDKKVTGDYELRHAYTVHSIQGETAKYNLYIDDKYVEPEIIYTALSRAEYLSQIYIIQG